MPDYCSIRVVNVGFRPATITGIGWKGGVIRKKYAIQTVHGHPASSKLPIKLDQGDEAHYLVGFLGDGTYPNWIDEFPKDFLSSSPRISSLTLKVQAFTSVGKTVEAKVEKGLRQRLVKAALKKNP